MSEMSKIGEMFLETARKAAKPVEETPKRGSLRQRSSPGLPHMAPDWLFARLGVPAAPPNRSAGGWDGSHGTILFWLLLRFYPRKRTRRWTDTRISRPRSVLVSCYPN